MVAEVLSRVPDAPGVPVERAADDAGARQLYLTCVVGGETYLVPAKAIREVEEVRAVTPVPTTPGWLLGVMNLRGAIVGVVDLARFLGLGGASHAGLRALSGLAGLPGLAGPATAEALICGEDETMVALAVDAVSAIRPLAAAEILPLPEPHGEAAVAPATRYLAGLYRAPDQTGPGAAGLLGVLDLERVLRAVDGSEGQGTGADARS